MSYSLRELLLLLETQKQTSVNEAAPTDIQQVQQMDAQMEQGQEMTGNEPTGEIPQEQPEAEGAAGDAEYLLPQDDSNAVPMQDLTPASEKQKSVKLFNHFNKMKTYGKAFEENLENIDLSLVEDEDYDEYLKLRDDIAKINEKISVYMREIYIEDSHKKRLYMYTLLRTELLTIIQSLRRVLGLNTEE